MLAALHTPVHCAVGNGLPKTHFAVVPAELNTSSSNAAALGRSRSDLATTTVWTPVWATVLKAAQLLSVVTMAPTKSQSSAAAELAFQVLALLHRTGLVPMEVVSVVGVSLMFRFRLFG